MLYKFPNIGNDIGPGARLWANPSIEKFFDFFSTINMINVNKTHGKTINTVFDENNLNTIEPSMMMMMMMRATETTEQKSFFSYKCLKFTFSFWTLLSSYQDRYCQDQLLCIWRIRLIWLNGSVRVAFIRNHGEKFINIYSRRNHQFDLFFHSIV